MINWAPFAGRIARYVLPAIIIALTVRKCFTQQASDSTGSPTTGCDVELDLARSLNNSLTDLMNAAICYQNANDIPKALKLYNEVRDNHPNFAYVLVNIGTVSHKNGYSNEAIFLYESYLRMVGFYNDTPPTDNTAIRHGSPCTPTSKFKSDCVNALNNLGAAYSITSNHTAGLFYLKRAIQIGDEEMLKSVYSNLGNHLFIIGDVDGAADAFIKSFWISVSNGDLNPAILARRAIIAPPILSSIEDADLVWSRFEARVQDLTKLAQFGGAEWSNDSSDLFRVFSGTSSLEQIRKLPPLANTVFDWINIQTPPFYLHYYGFHDRAMNELVSKMYGSLCPPSLFEVAPHLSGYQLSPLVMAENAPTIPIPDAPQQLFLPSKEEEAQRGEKLRVGFISSHFGADEPHGLLLIDVIRRLPSSIFDVIAIGIGSSQPAKEFVDAVSGNFLLIGYNDFTARDVLKSQKLDALVFAEIQNEAVVHFLGFQRFAPIQILVMGAPVTSGNPCVDYFISGDRLEHPFRTKFTGDMTHKEPYSEQVVLFDGQAISFPLEESNPEQDAALAAGDAYIANKTIPGREMDEFGIPIKIKGSPIYMCFQNLFKIQPSFDFVIAQILHADPNGYVVLQASRNKPITERISERIMSSFIDSFCPYSSEGKSCALAKEAFSRVIFIPRVTNDKMHDVFRRSSVVLHPFPFDGSKTAADTLEAGVPLVTYPQPYLRGHMAVSFFTTMELHTVDLNVAASSCCVANSVSDYVTKALRLGRDEKYREKVASAISKRSYRIWNDRQTSFEWARFLTRALGVSLSDDDLSSRMDYKPEPWQEDEIIAAEIEKEQKRWKRSLSRGDSRQLYELS